MPMRHTSPAAPKYSASNPSIQARSYSCLKKSIMMIPLDSEVIKDLLSPCEKGSHKKHQKRNEQDVDDQGKHDDLLKYMSTVSSPIRHEPSTPL